LSGFLYQGIGGARLDAIYSQIPVPRPELPDDVLEGVDLGYPQECFFFDSEGKYTPNNQFVPGFEDLQNELSTYIWSVTECGGKVFIGTLDLTNIIFVVLKGLILSMFLPDVSDIVADIPITERVLDTFVYIILAMLLDEVLGEDRPPLSPYEFGFNIMYAEVEDISKCNVSGCENIWKYVTTDGFSRLTDTDEPFVIAGLAQPNVELGILGYLRPNLNTEDGVRQLVCSSGQYLHIGSTAYGDVGSNTYILDIESDKGNDLCPVQEAIAALFPL